MSDETTQVNPELDQTTAESHVPGHPHLPQTNITLPSIPLKVFVKVSGMTADQIAGFRRWAISLKISSRTMPEWKELHEKFLKLPV